MVGSKSGEQLAHDDTFSCLSCGTIVTITPRPNGPGKSSRS
jgi:hypothetical protein